MLRYPLTHPDLLAVLGSAGHGSKILVADGNYAHRTGTNAAAPVIHLNLRPGLVTVQDVLEVLADACPVEALTLLSPDDGSPSPVELDYRRILGETIPVNALRRTQFRQACTGQDIAATVATGDRKHYANALVTIGALPDLTLHDVSRSPTAC